MWLPLVTLAAAAGLGHLAVSSSASPSHASHSGVVGSGYFPLCAGSRLPNCVVDGDTIHFHGETIRIEDINAPETNDPKCAREATLGRRATERLLTELNAGDFTVVYTGGRDEDVYGRKLRLIERNGRSIGHTLVDAGLAHWWEGYKRSWCG